MDPSVIYKLLPAEEWEIAESAGVFVGSAIDVRDGFIHFSTAAQAPETARRHFAGRTGLTLLAVATAPLGDALRWEPSRGGELFPHLYADLPVDAVVGSAELPDAARPDAVGDDGGPGAGAGEDIARAVADAIARW
ncbi:DUF952 domain-containing protein [Yinghuangia sp. ASG 101]|uniref:DUF952 domain-containing protein n=1 Tax=Yinghuangia sp. ASG 101 TaxID=2896848 RepID=UPI001E4AA4F6|nr:DUF952 domain-containing protein [Yinghuangia sp. ASG 101]UGQ10878.1 DUF952 domain-containing protein [Yinghuangia sp. ASG 101]